MPQQNIVAERKNCTLIEMTRYMLHAKNLDLKLWVEAINYSNYLLNHLPSKCLQNITPKQKWSGRKPSV